MKTQKSDKLFERAVKIIPGGVNSPVRAFKSVGRTPVFIDRASGCRMWDVDGNEYIDYVGSWGPMILGHKHPRVIESIRKTAIEGTSFGAATEREVEMAELICSLVPSVEMVRMVNSGTEATMSAIRLARAATGRDKIIKFEGCYHGHGDAFLFKAGSGAMTFGVPDSAGVPASVGTGTLTAKYNSLGSVEELIHGSPDQIAGIIVEPVVGNMGCVLPEPGFLEGLRTLCDTHGILLIFDEVMTGFRLAAGGAQELFRIKPDLTTMGKVIGGGLPVGAYGGSKDLMEKVAPSGPMYQAGTLSGNPLAMAAGMETLRILKEDVDFYKKLDKTSSELASGLEDIIKRSRFPARINRLGSMMTLFFTAEAVTDYDSAKTADTTRFGSYFRFMLEQGVYLPPSQFEAAFVSAAHRSSDVEKTLEAAEIALSRVFSQSKTD